MTFKKNILIVAFKTPKILKLSNIILPTLHVFCDLQEGRVLEYKVTDANFILQKEVTQRMSIHFLQKNLYLCILYQFITNSW